MKRIYVLWICILNTDDPFAVLVLVLDFEHQVLDNSTAIDYWKSVCLCLYNDNISTFGYLSSNEVFGYIGIMTLTLQSAEAVIFTAPFNEDLGREGKSYLHHWTKLKGFTVICVVLLMRYRSCYEGLYVQGQGLIFQGQDLHYQGPDRASEAKAKTSKWCPWGMRIVEAKAKPG